MPIPSLDISPDTGINQDLVDSIPLLVILPYKADVSVRAKPYANYAIIIGIILVFCWELTATSKQGIMRFANIEYVPLMEKPGQRLLAQFRIVFLVAFSRLAFVDCVLRF